MLSKKGSQDDVSLACIFNVEVAKPILVSIVHNAKLELEVTTTKKMIDQLKNELSGIKQERDDWQKKYEGKEQLLNSERDAHSKTKSNVQRLEKEKNDLETRLKSLIDEQGKYRAAEQRRQQIETSLKKELENEKIKNEKKKPLPGIVSNPSRMPQATSISQPAKTDGASTGNDVEQYADWGQQPVIAPTVDENRARDFKNKEQGNNFKSCGDKCFDEKDYLSAKDFYEQAQKQYDLCGDDILKTSVVGQIELCNRKIGVSSTSPQDNAVAMEKTQIDILA
jgi:hypothetical protein